MYMNNSITDYPSNNMPKLYYQAGATFFVKDGNGGFYFYVTTPFYGTITVTCSNEFDFIEQKITIKVECSPTSTVLTEPTVFLNGTAFPTT